MLNILKYEFMQNALIASFLASIVCGIIGVIIVEKKLVMMSGGIAHTAYGGVGLGYLLNFEPIIGAVIFSVAAAFGIGYIRRRNHTNADVIIALFWSLGMALGLIFVGFMPGYPPDINSYLFGNILSVTRTDLILIAVITVIVAINIFVFFNDWKAFLFDNSFAKILGAAESFMEYALFVMIALTVVVLIRVVGIILVIALLSAPAASAALLSKNFKNRIITSIILGIIFCFSGIFVSYAVDISSGAAIIIISIMFYVITFAVKNILSKIKNKTISTQR